MEALLGRLWVQVVEDNSTMNSATFEVDSGHPTVRGTGPHPLKAEILFPGATIGRGSSTDLRVVEPPAPTSRARTSWSRPAAASGR